MTLDEIQGIIAGGDGENSAYNSEFNSQYPNPEQEVDNVVENVQNVLQREIEAHKNFSTDKITLDTPDVSDNWDTILTTIFGTTGNTLTANDIMNQDDIDIIKTTTVKSESSEVTSYNNVKEPEVVNISPLPSLTDLISANAQNYNQQKPTTHDATEKITTAMQFTVGNNVAVSSTPKYFSSQEEIISKNKVPLNQYSSTELSTLENKLTTGSIDKSTPTTSEKVPSK